MDTIEIDAIITFKDLLRINYWYLFRKYSTWISLLLVIFIPLVVIQSWEAIIPMILTVAFLPLVMYRISKNEFKSNKVISGMIHYRFSNQGIDITHSLGSSQLNWDIILEAYETKSAFIMFISKRLMNVIPKSAFKDRATIDNVRNILKKYLTDKAKFFLKK